MYLLLSILRTHYGEWNIFVHPTQNNSVELLFPKPNIFLSAIFFYFEMHRTLTEEKQKDKVAFQYLFLQAQKLLIATKHLSSNMSSVI